MTRHIDKENTVLFPRPKIVLEKSKDIELFEAFETIGARTYRRRKTREFHLFLDQLQNAYLNE